jgi:hypothetical protein
MTATTGIPAPTYDPHQTLRQGRARYFERYGFGDGGYDAKWVELNKVGPLPIGFPNTAARVRAVKLHDLHHVLTGYAADYTGEAEIAAWELGAGCGPHVAAWILNLAAVGYGSFIAPRRVARALARGLSSRSLYAHRELEEAMLERRLGEVRAELSLDGPAPEPGLRHYLGTALLALGGIALVLGPIVAIAAGLVMLF